MPTKSIALRIDNDLLNYLETRAEKEHRTLSNMIISILLDAQTNANAIECVKTLARNTANFPEDYKRAVRDCLYVLKDETLMFGAKEHAEPPISMAVTSTDNGIAAGVLTGGLTIKR